MKESPFVYLLHVTYPCFINVHNKDKNRNSVVTMSNLIAFWMNRISQSQSAEISLVLCEFQRGMFVSVICQGSFDEYSKALVCYHVPGTFWRIRVEIACYRKRFKFSIFNFP